MKRVEYEWFVNESKDFIERAIEDLRKECKRKRGIELEMEKVINRMVEVSYSDVRKLSMFFEQADIERYDEEGRNEVENTLHKERKRLRDLVRIQEEFKMRKFLFCFSLSEEVLRNGLKK